MRASRRDFLVGSGGAMAAAAFAFGAASELVANPLGKPIGLELYTVGAELDKDYDGTLRAIAAIGYKEVETGVSATRKAADVKKSLQAAGLQCRAMHMSFGGMEEAIPYAAEIGAKYVISSVTLPSVPEAGKFDMKAMMAQLTALNLDDFKKIAARCNTMGEQAKKAGLQFGYHNHNFEFKPQDGGAIGYDVVLKETDPALVKFELDCGWMVAAGHDPVAYLTKYPTRYRLLHIKDFQPTDSPSVGLDESVRPKPAELGRGHIDYKPIFAAAKKTEVELYYVEQEPPFTATPAMEAIKIDYDYLHALA
ncbi:MAG TPA: sugar phosphate isomerase/epimerase [Candidatus Acidoferrum sp.]|nr:sugar phosphate isomerase/epimerase [Candidatus Acidoferrum sp.]